MAGIVTVSVEVELGWGMHDQLVYDHLSPAGDAEASTLEKLLAVCDDADIPITFDVVGHLFHESCPGHHTGPYPDSWWQADPGTSADDDPLFYAPGLISAIRHRETDHEIATHTYSHMLADESSPDLLDHELERVNEVHSAADLPSPNSIVLPRHQTPSYEVLSDHDITTIRRPVETYGNPSSTPIGKLYWLATRSHPVTNLEESNGVVETKCTPHPSLSHVLLPQGQRDVGPLPYRIIPIQARQRLHRRYLQTAVDRAAETGRHVHLWSHLFNFSNPLQWEGVEAGLRHLAKRRDEGGIKIMKMEDLPEAVGP